MNVLVTDPVAEEAVSKLRESCEVEVRELSSGELLKEIHKYHALVVRSRTKVTKEVIAKAKKLKVIGRAGVGVDNIDVKEASRRKIAVVNAPTSATVSVAELAFVHMLALARKIPNADSGMRKGKWEKKILSGIELKGKTLGLIGCGRIGSELVRRAKAFGMRVIACDPYLKEERAKQLGIELISLGDLLTLADFISLHLPLTAETKGMIGEHELAQMKSSAYLVNCARGGIVDEDALYSALKHGKIAGAGLDVYQQEPPAESKLLVLDNILLTPHLGASTKEAQINAGLQVAEQVLKVLNGEKPEFCVNPEVLNEG